MFRFFKIKMITFAFLFLSISLANAETIKVKLETSMGEIHLDLYSDRQKKRHNVRPGLTGWAQINGRNNISWKQKFELDLYYIDNQNLEI